LTRFHLDTLRKSNPDVFIQPLTDSVPELLSGSIDVGTLPPFCVDADKWRSIDATVYRWFHNRTFNAKRYLMFEYDCFCNVSLRDYYSAVWDADVAGIEFFTRQEYSCWHWFMDDELERIPRENREYAAGIVPFTCTFFSHQALEKIAANVDRQDIFCELRLGTAVNKLGLKFQRLQSSRRSTLCWHEYPWQINRPGFFHAIKSLDHNTGKPRQPGAFASYVADFLRSSNPERILQPFLWRRKLSGIKMRLGWMD
jgi:hypothetical protein